MAAVRLGVRSAYVVLFTTSPSKIEDGTSMYEVGVLKNADEMKKQARE